MSDKKNTCPHCGADAKKNLYVREVQLYSNLGVEAEKLVVRCDRGEVDEVQVICGNCNKQVDIEVEWI